MRDQMTYEVGIDAIGDKTSSAQAAPAAVAAATLEAASRAHLAAVLVVTLTEQVTAVLGTTNRDVVESAIVLYVEN